MKSSDKFYLVIFAMFIFFLSFVIWTVQNHITQKQKFIYIMRDYIPEDQLQEYIKNTL